MTVVAQALPATVRGVLLVAHRMPTSADACRALQRAGADLFEVDLQLDGTHLVVSHYAPFAAGRGRLHHDGWRLRWGPRAGRDPLLTTLRANLPGGARLLLDPKEREPHRRDALVDRIAEEFPDRDHVVVSTGRPRDLERLRRAGFETWRSIGDRAALGRALAEGTLPEAAVTVRHTLLDEPTVTRLREGVGRVVAWTVNRPARARRLRELGVTGITTDRAAVMAAMQGSPR